LLLSPARIYLPEEGVFASRDPVDWYVGPYSKRALYQYVGQQSVTVTDPMGLEWVMPSVLEVDEKVRQKDFWNGGTGLNPDDDKDKQKIKSALAEYDKGIRDELIKKVGKGTPIKSYDLLLTDADYRKKLGIPAGNSGFYFAYTIGAKCVKGGCDFSATKYYLIGAITIFRTGGNSIVISAGFAGTDIVQDFMAPLPHELMHVLGTPDLFIKKWERLGWRLTPYIGYLGEATKRVAAARAAFGTVTALRDYLKTLNRCNRLYHSSAQANWTSPR
jgi:hypothetical protein